MWLASPTKITFDLNVIRKSNFAKTSYKAISHPPLETVLISRQDQKTEIKATSFKISDDRTLITSLIEQPNSTNESLHVMGTQIGL